MRYSIEQFFNGTWMVVDSGRIISAGHPTKESAEQWAKEFGDAAIKPAGKKGGNSYATITKRD